MAGGDETAASSDDLGAFDIGGEDGLVGEGCAPAGGATDADALVACVVGAGDAGDAGGGGGAECPLPSGRDFGWTDAGGSKRGPEPESETDFDESEAFAADARSTRAFERGSRRVNLSVRPFSPAGVGP